MEQQSDRLAIVLLLGFIVASLIARFTYAIDVSMIDTRALMITATVFGAIGKFYLVPGANRRQNPIPRHGRSIEPICRFSFRTLAE